MEVIPSIAYGGITLITPPGDGITVMAMAMFGVMDLIIFTIGIDHYGSTMAEAGAGAGTVLIGTLATTTVHTSEMAFTMVITKVATEVVHYLTIERDAVQQMLHVQKGR